MQRVHAYEPDTLNTDKLAVNKWGLLTQVCQNNELFVMEMVVIFRKCAFMEPVKRMIVLFDIPVLVYCLLFLISFTSPGPHRFENCPLRVLYWFL